MVRLFLSFVLCTSYLSALRAETAVRDSENLSFPVGDFTLTERDGRTVRASDLAGKVWVASFVFTRCGGPCPRVTATMGRLQETFAAEPDFRLVTITVDPQYDTPAVLTKYADSFGADPKRWLFLTGAEADVDRVLSQNFHVGAEKVPGAAPVEAVTHQTFLALVDKQGRVRGYYDGVADSEGDNPKQDFEQDQERLRRRIGELLSEGGRSEVFPAVNAALNGLAGVLLLVGYGAIRRRLIRLHIACMITALAVSAVFLASYLYYHLVVMHGRPTYFHEKWPEAPSWVGAVYLAVLTSHTLLAVVTAPLALFTAYQGLRWRLARHVAVARWTLPIWLYVSATGVVVYWMLYRLY